MSAIINQISDGLGGIATSLSSAFNMIVYQLGKFIRRMMHYIKVAFDYLVRYLRIAFRYVRDMYIQFQKDPFGTIQFFGTLAILINSGVL